MIGVGLAEGLEFFRRAGVLEAAPGIHVGQHDDLLRRQDLGGVGHEFDPAKGNHLGIGRRRLLGQLQRIADIIGQILNLGPLIIMREDDRVALLLDPRDFGEDVHAGEVFGHDGHGLGSSKLRW